MATSEIEKLERRYAENPHGLTFAPLAEVHRKNGDVSRALELLRVGLELHPNYIPASIVLGRCHQDLGDLPAAEEAFAHVLRLDDENVIALKSLADINERQDRLDDAERWLLRLVSVDRSNDEARQQLQRIDAARAEHSRSAPAPAAPSRGDVPADIAVIRPTAAESTAPEPTAAEPTAPEPPAQPASATASPSQPAEIVPLELTEDLKEPAPEEPAPEPATLHEARPAAPLEVPPKLLSQEAEFAAPEPAHVPGLDPSPFEPPKLPPGPLGIEIETESDVVLNSSGASEFTVPDASQDLAVLAARLNASRPRTPGRRAADRAPTPPREAVVQPEPAPPPAEPPTAPAPAPEPAAPVRAYSARETQGQSIAAFFQALLVARPPADASAAAHSSNSTPKGESAPPASPSSQGKDGVVSFDDLFGSGSGGNSVGPGAGEPGRDDLDQFHSWLQNLKR